MVSFIKVGKIEHKKVIGVKMSLDLVVLSLNYQEELINSLGIRS